jgi:hypothetical protein
MNGVQFVKQIGTKPKSSINRTSKDEEFVITNDLPSDLIIFSCSSNFEFLTNSAEEMFVDGTFRFCPNLFYTKILHFAVPRLPQMKPTASLRTVCIVSSK